ncbi:rod shape-determining protein MreD [Endozoicomonadaceae bacterium StTr2]
MHSDYGVMMGTARGQWVVLLSVLVAYVLSLVPLPEVLMSARPYWLALVVMYWVLALPQRYGLFFAWGTGLLLDVMEGAILGQNALTMVMVSMITLKLHQRLRMYPWWQQSFMVLVIIGIAEMMKLWVKSAIANRLPSLYMLMPALSSAFLWPWIYAILRYLRQRFNVS